MKLPVIGFSAYSGTGKTTVIERVTRLLTARGIRVGVIKHDRHGFEIDKPGKDSHRHARAGASVVIITSPDKTAIVLQNGESLSECLHHMQNVDLVLVEGFKHADIPRIGLCRAAAGKGFTEPPDRFFAIITDVEKPEVPVPQFTFEDTAGIADFIMKEMDRLSTEDFTHFNDQGRARMVNVGEKSVTHRTASASGRVLVNRETFDLIKSGGVKKGDVLTVAQIAGIMAAKHTPDLIPMCHPVPLSGIDLKLWLDETRLSVEITASAQCDGKTGVEMEVLTAVSSAALTVYDMCKAVQRDMVIADIRLISKMGGIHGDYYRREDT